MGIRSKGQHYAPTVLNERHKELLRRIALGERQQDAARQMGITTRMASYVRNSPAGQAYLRELVDGRDASARDIAAQLYRLAPSAVATLEAALRGELGGSAVDMFRFKAAEAVLDRCGYARMAKQDVTVTKYTGIEHIRRLAEAMSAPNPNIPEFSSVETCAQTGETGTG